MTRLYRQMKTKSLALSLALFGLAVAACLAADPELGTWKLNEEKSTLTEGSGKNTTVVYQSAGDSVKITTDGVDGKGKPMHTEWTGKYDGKDYPVTGDSSSAVRSYKKVDDRTLEFTVKRDGDVTVTGRVVISADGKSRTVTTSGTESDGKKFKNMAVYHKQ